MIYVARLQHKLNMPLNQHVSKTKQNILVVTFGGCSIPSLFEFFVLGSSLSLFVFLRSFMRQRTSLSIITFATCLRLSLIVHIDRTHTWLVTCRSSNDSRIEPQPQQAASGDAAFVFPISFHVGPCGDSMEAKCTTHACAIRATTAGV